MSRARVYLSQLARQDLEDIWLYIAADSEKAADAWLERLQDKAHELAVQPGLGRARPELAEGVRSFPVRAYMLYYRLVDNGIELVRAVHVARDIGGLTGLSSIDE